MPRTEVRGGQIKDTSVQRADLDVSTPGQATAVKIIAGTNITLGSTGVDPGTGDVTINSSGGAAGDIALTMIAPAVDETIPAGYSAHSVRSYKIASGKKLIIGLGARFKII